MTTDLPEGLARYFVIREQQRAERVGEALAAMTDREQALAREAAVMGYVQGVWSQPGSHRRQFPPDLEVLRTVVDACLAIPDLYPTISGYEPGGDEGESASRP